MHAHRVGTQVEVGVVQSDRGRHDAESEQQLLQMSDKKTYRATLGLGGAIRRDAAIHQICFIYVRNGILEMYARLK